MTLPRCLPHPASCLSAAALYLFSLGVAFAMTLVLPLLWSLMHHAPRLAWLGIVLMWIAPIPVAAAAHRVGHHVLDLFDSKRITVAETRATSLWAGFVAWSSIVLVSLLTTLIMLAIDPPPMEPDALSGLVAEVTRLGPGGVRTAIWVVLAAYVYELDRSARVGASAD